MRLQGQFLKVLFVIFQMTFAIITVAIISGSIAERMKFGAFHCIHLNLGSRCLCTNYSLGMGWWLVSK